MDTTIDFDDAIYKHTGIARMSAAMQTKTFLAENGKSYTLQVTKRDLGDQKFLYIALKDISGMPVNDLKVTAHGRGMTLTLERSQDSVVLDLSEDTSLEGMQITSEAEGLKAYLTVRLEKPLEKLAEKKTMKQGEEQKAKKPAKGKMKE
ncbi:MAG: hypothetical protein FJ123_00885 [Deltaproteobacteria bacterium]|nr:hypothetical protein [Deltaproteobacteria bacterium]